MTVIFSTLGFTPDALLPLITHFPDVEKVVFYYSTEKEERVVKAKEEVIKVCVSLTIPVEANELENYVDIIPMIKRMRDDLQQYERDNVVFNITGGTKAMAGAAIITSILEGIQVVFNDWENNRVVEYPVLRMRYEDTLTKRQKEILKYIHRKDECKFSEVVKSMGVSKSTISHHIRELEEKGFIERKAIKEDKREQIIRAKEVAELVINR